MLRNTFLHLPGIGYAYERLLWESGVLTWEDFLSAPSLPSALDGRRDRLRPLVEESVKRHDSGDAVFFARALPPREVWRLYADYRHSAAFLDIETTGLSPYSSYLTLVGLLDQDGYHGFVRDDNLLDLREALERYDLVVTFNGASFDLPYVEHSFGSVFAHVAHLDLMYPLRRLGYGGGLKRIEAMLGVGRPSELTGLSGYDAVRLWRMWTMGSAGALETLVRYNAEDVASLPALADLAYNELAETLWPRLPRLEPSPRHDIDLPYDPAIVAALTYG